MSGGGLTRIIVAPDFTSSGHHLSDGDTLSFSTRDSSYEIVTDCADSQSARFDFITTKTNLSC